MSGPGKGAFEGEATAGLVVPAWATWGQRAGLLLPRYRGLGPGGRRLCRWCDNECQPPRVVWCSQACVDAYTRVWSWEAIRSFVIQRDAATCQRCGTTNPPVPTEKERELWEGGPVIKSRHRFDPWDVDHIVRVADDGTDDPANLRLLCMPCHVAVGYEQRAENSPQAALALALTPDSDSPTTPADTDRTP